jgi:pimeloyl-ACP methyl ester carboxylesterase
MALRAMLIGAAVVLVLLALSAAATAVGAWLIARAHPPSGSFVEVEGGRLHVVDRDRRERRPADDLPILLLHGASGNLEDMRLALGDRLARFHRVILVDRPGHGWSERPANGASPARQAAMVSEMLGRLGIARVVVVAHSFAGSVATAMALDDPARIAGLVLLAPVSHPWPGGIAWYYTIASAPMIGPLFAHTIVLPVGMLLMPSVIGVVFDPQKPPRDYAERAAITLVLRPRNFLANARDVVGIRAFVTMQAARYSAIKAPTIILHGTGDTVVAARVHARALADAVPHAQLMLLDGIGHMPHHVATDRVVAAIDAVMAQARTAPR